MAAVELVRYVHIVLLTLFLRETQEPVAKNLHSLIKRGKRGTKKQLLIYYTFSYTFCWITVQLVAHRNISFGSKSHTNDLMIFVTMNLALRAFCLMTQEHETELRDFFVRKKVNSHDIIFMNMRFLIFVCLFELKKKKFSQWDWLFLFLDWVKIDEIQ